ncbi:isocitrate dehydrogenase kinase/phosphatase AceK regulatory subunit [Shigella flexneri]
MNCFIVTRPPGWSEADYPFRDAAVLLPIHRTDEGELFVDTCLTTTAEASIVVGFARSYFMVYAPLPAALVEWLREPAGKTTAELYMAIGCQKHAKTESYREYLFSTWPTVMSSLLKRRNSRYGDVVFTLLGFDRVFKIIKDKFAPQKRCPPPTSAPVINWSKSTIVRADG